MAVKISHYLIKDLHKFCKESIEGFKSLNSTDSFLLERSALKLMPVLDEVLLKMLDEKVPKIGKIIN
jgi:hypothetical protein